MIREKIQESERNCITLMVILTTSEVDLQNPEMIRERECKNVKGSCVTLIVTEVDLQIP